MISLYRKAKLGLLVRILELEGRLSKEETVGCLLYEDFNKHYNQSPQELAVKCSDIAEISGGSLTSKVLTKLLYQPGFFKKIERKYGHIIYCSNKSSFCYLIKRHRKALDYNSLKQLVSVAEEACESRDSL